MGSGKHRGSFSVALSAVAVAAGGCQGASHPTFAGPIALSVDGPNVTGSLPAPCELDVDFGTLGLGQLETAAIEVENHSGRTVNFLPFSAQLDPAFRLSFNGFQTSLAAGASSTIHVTFGPVRTGLATTTIAIPDNLASDACGGTSSSIVIRLTGVGAQFGLSVSPLVIDFGKTLLNTTSTQTVTLHNDSTAPITGIVATLNGSDADRFTVQAPTSLEIGASADVQIGYSPTSAESSQNDASLAFTAAEGETTGVSLVGEPILVGLVAPPPIDFKFVPLGTTLTACTSIVNEANVELHILSAPSLSDAAGVFAASTHDDATPPNRIAYPMALQAGASARLCFDFTPVGAKQYTGKATLETDDPSGDRPSLGLSGWGGGPQISCAPASLDFRTVLAHTPVTLPVTCANTGSSLPGVTLLLFPAVDASVFAAHFDDTVIYPAAGLAPGQSAQIDVTYDPASSSIDQGTLIIASNAGQGEPVRIPLSGSGLQLPPCQFVLSPPTLDFGNLAPGGTTVPLTFEVQNIGQDACAIQGLGIRDDPTGSFEILSTSIQVDPVTDWISVPGGSTLSVVVQFHPAGQGAFSAEAAFSITAPDEPNQVVTLTGTSESTCLLVTPTAMNFGQVGTNPTGALCSGGVRSLTVLDSCSTPATIQAVTLAAGPGDPTAAFLVSSGPSLPMTLQPGQAPSVFDLRFEPSTLGKHTAQVLISDGAVESRVALSGEAVTASSETDAVVVGPPPADLLVVVDADDDPQQLSAFVSGVPALIAAGAGIDYRIAVTTDDDYAPAAYADFGRLLPCPTCSLVGAAPTIISPDSIPPGGYAPDPSTALSDLVSSVKENQYPTGTPIDEHMFLALYNALQHSGEPGVDFFRPGAYFAALTINGDDEDDSSSLGVGGHDTAWFANYFETYFQDSALFSWNYFVPSGIFTGPNFTDLALPPQVSEMLAGTNGVAVTTADPNWSTTLASLWTGAIAASKSYALTGTPSDGQSSIRVTRNGTTIPQLEAQGDPNWTYQPGINTVAFTSNVSLLAGDRLEFTYSIDCN